MAAIDLTLLHYSPQPRLDRLLAKQTLTFAFAAGTGSDPFDRLLTKLRRPVTTFASDCFAADLFLDSFVERCLTQRVPGSERRFHASALRKVLAAPPTSPKDIELRQQVFNEIKLRPELFIACQTAWKKIDGLRIQLESADLLKRYDTIQRRIEILREFDETLRELMTSFDSATSALHRITDFARSVIAESGYGAVTQLLDYDERLATVELSVQLDREGQIRNLSIHTQQENSKNPLHRGPGTRLWQRLLSLFHGYHLREHEIVGRLIEAVFDQVCPALISLFELGLDLEFYLAVDGFRRLCENQKLEVCLPRMSAPSEASPLRLVQLFNPFLVLEERRPVPCDITLERSGFVLLTGPNSGGKTRLLQALGFVQLLAQSGAWVPAREATVPIRTGLLVSLVHESSADQKEGRLGTELLRIRRLFERLEYDQLVLLDELCSGTNPSEGEEIVELVISLLTKLRPQAVVTTHFLQFAERLSKRPPVDSLRFLQVSLDARLHPLYQFVPGVASTSLACQTAERLGVTREALETLIASKRDDARE
jgi:DNA mismatch repair protein MutS2